jgi:hypothetical protein
MISLNYKQLTELIQAVEKMIHLWKKPPSPYPHAPKTRIICRVDDVDTQ